MQKRSGWSASAAKALLLFSLVTHCVSAVAIASTGTPISSSTIPPLPTATTYGAGGSNSASSSTGLLLSTSGTIRSSNSSSLTSTSTSSSLLTSSTSSSLPSLLPTSPGSITTPTGSLPSTASSSSLSLYTLPTSPGSTTSPTGSLPGTTSSSSNNSSLYTLPTSPGSTTSSIGSLPGTTSSSSNNSSLYTLPTSLGSTTSSTGSLPGTTSSSSLSLYSVTFGAPSIAAATIIQSGKTETVPVIIGGSYSSPITLPPVTTTFAGSQATSSVSSVSSELAGLIPIINSWKANPTLLKSDTLNKINPIKSDVEDLISNLGADSSSLGCGSKKKRGLLDTVGDIISRLSCIDEDLNSITNNINAEDVNVDDFLDDLKSENDNLTDDDDNNNNSNTNSNSDPSTITLTSSSSSSLSSCISSNTALQVTVQCVPTLFTTSGSTISTTTCSPLTTVTTSGCSVTGLTTTVSTSITASRTQTACASGTCGDACPMNGGPLSGASMGVGASTEDCASISTITTSALPTASYGVIGGIAIASPTPESFAAAPSKRSFQSDPVAYDRDLVDRSIVERALPELTPPYADYVQSLTPTWISQEGDASGQFFNYPPVHASAGVNGLYGCTSVIISSEKGVYISHIWENPVFITGDFVPTDDNTFTTKAFNALRDGTANAQSILTLVGTDQAPGPLNAIYSPKVFVLTPFTSDLDRQLYSITTTLRYETRAQQLAQQIVQIVPGSGGTGFTLGYTRTSAQQSTQNPGVAGRAIWEVDPFQYWLTTPNAPATSPGLQVGQWRLWVEDQFITQQDFWVPHTTPPGGIQGRDVGYANPCAALASSSSTTATASGTSTISSVTSKTSSTLVTSTTSPSDVLNPSSCKYTVTSEIGIINAEYTLQPTIATMCLCDSSVQAGINTVTGTSSTSYLVCEVPSKITVSTLQPPSTTNASPPSITAPPPTPVTTLVQSTTTPSQATKSPDLSSKVCVDCTNALGASECSAPNDQCLVDQCKNDKNCQTCGIDCSSFFDPGKPDPQPGPRPYR